SRRARRAPGSASPSPAPPTRCPCRRQAPTPRGGTVKRGHVSSTNPFACIAEVLGGVATVAAAFQGGQECRAEAGRRVAARHLDMHGPRHVHGEGLAPSTPRDRPY